MTVTLSDETLRTAEALAAARGHANVGEYLKALVEADQERAATLAAIREGLAQADAGQMRPLREAMADIARKRGLQVAGLTGAARSR